ncbi:helix-turn-helix domain-containing protein [Streptomyces sp. 4N509B]|uniref:helix-turn-helix domain-containing protein n=1 Tax=Streptomyces sp. 4N509B TaxID=3457413 RepID=UPI003FD32E1E
MKDCRNPKCHRPFEPNRRGRPKEYCDKRCRDAAARDAAARDGAVEPLPTSDRHPGGVREVAEDLARRAEEARRLAHDDDGAARTSLRALRLALELERDVTDLQAVIVQQARDRGVPVAALARSFSRSPGAVGRRFSAAAIDRRMAQRRRRLEEAERARRGAAGTGRGGADTADTPRAADAAGTAPTGNDGAAGGGAGAGGRGTADTMGGAAAERATPRSPRRRRREANGPDEGPLVSALLALRRTSGQTLRALGEEAGVSASYVSRVLSGERRPSWRVTECLVRACGGDPADVLPLWVDARGHPLPRGVSPADLHYALRGLHQVAGQPDPETVHAVSNGQLSRDDVVGVLHGGELPDWGTVDRFVQVLGGRPERYRQLWRAAQSGRGSLTPPDHAADLPASSFG